MTWDRTLGKDRKRTQNRKEGEWRGADMQWREGKGDNGDEEQEGSMFCQSPLTADPSLLKN